MSICRSFVWFVEVGDRHGAVMGPANTVLAAMIGTRTARTNGQLCSALSDLSWLSSNLSSHTCGVLITATDRLNSLLSPSRAQHRPLPHGAVAERPLLRLPRVPGGSGGRSLQAGAQLARRVRAALRAAQRAPAHAARQGPKAAGQRRLGQGAPEQRHRRQPRTELPVGAGAAGRRAGPLAPDPARELLAAAAAAGAGHQSCRQCARQGYARVRPAVWVLLLLCCAAPECELKDPAWRSNSNDATEAQYDSSRAASNLHCSALYWKIPFWIARLITSDK